MIPKLKDLKTGEEKWYEQDTNEKEISIFSWTEGNYSCDCNRAITFGADVYKEMAEEFPQGYCWGSKRFIVVDVKGDLEGWNKDELIRECNSDYPKEEA